MQRCGQPRGPGFLPTNDRIRLVLDDGPAWHGAVSRRRRVGIRETRLLGARATAAPRQVLAVACHPWLAAGGMALGGALDLDYDGGAAGLPRRRRSHGGRFSPLVPLKGAPVPS